MGALACSQEFQRNVKREFGKLLTVLQAYALICTHVSLTLSPPHAPASAAPPSLWYVPQPVQTSRYAVRPPPQVRINASNQVSGGARAVVVSTQGAAAAAAASQRAQQAEGSSGGGGAATSLPQLLTNIITVLGTKASALRRPFCCGATLSACPTSELATHPSSLCPPCWRKEPEGFRLGGCLLVRARWRRVQVADTLEPLQVDLPDQRGRIVG